MTDWVKKDVALARYRYFRTAWSRRASYHLTKKSLSTVWQERLISACWLAANGIPWSGEAPSMKFKGLKP